MTSASLLGSRAGPCRGVARPRRNAPAAFTSAPAPAPRRSSLLVRAAAGDQQASPSSSTAVESGKSRVLKSRKQRRQELEKTAAQEAEEAQEDTGPRRARDAIQQGLERFQAGDYQGAIELFNLSLELPGSGAYRLPGSPREYSCPSEAEENAALYNMACAYARLGQASSSLTCLEAVLDNGFKEYDTMRNDADLAPLRGAGLEQLISRYDNPVSKLQQMFKKPDKIVSDTNKPWLLW